SAPMRLEGAVACPSASPPPLADLERRRPNTASEWRHRTFGHAAGSSGLSGLTEPAEVTSMRDEVRFPTAVVGLILFAGCARSGAPSGAGAGGASTGVTTPASRVAVSSPPASPDGVAAVAAAPKVAFTLFQNVRIFDGKAEKLTDPRNVMVHGNIIERV